MPYITKKNLFRQFFQLSIWFGCLILISVQDLAAQSKPLQEVYKNDCLNQLILIILRKFLKK
jgi:hypothetical protein